MSLHWALAHLRQDQFQLQAPESNRGDRPYESQLGASRACNVSDQGESRTPMPVRARRSERRVSTSCTTWSVVPNSPYGIRTGHRPVGWSAGVSGHASILNR